MKTMNEFLKEAEECIKENDVSTNTAGSVAGVQGKPDTLVGTSMGGDWKRYLKTILARTARVIRRTKG